MCFFSLSSFPTIYFAPAGKKQSPKKYEVSILLFLMLCKEVKSIQVFKSYSSLFGVGGGTVSCYPGNTPDGTCWECCTLCCRSWGEACLQSPGSPALAPEPPLRRGEAGGGYRSCLTVVCFLQGGREVSDFISYLKREATNTPVLQEEEKSKKSKKKVKEDL